MARIPVTVAFVGVFFNAFFLSGVAATLAADLPDPTRKFLQQLKFDESTLAGLDKELEMPAAWLEGARNEGAVAILGTWDANQFEEMVLPFRARYPFVKMDYARAGRYDRTIKTLVAAKDGRLVGDIMLSAGRTLTDLREIGALADLRDIPNFALAAPDMAASDGTWVGSRIAYRCMGYNTKRVKKEELPATWDDLINDPRWRNGRLALSNSPDSWILGLWDTNGEAWARDYITKLFEVVKPQLRKEGQNASYGLLMAGEFDAVIPASGDRAQQYLDRGAPAGFHCPSPVPASVSQTILLKGSAHPNGARIFLNWFLSKEGQIAQFATSGQNPIHKDLQGGRFVDFPSEIVGKPVSFRESAELEETQAELQRFWTAMWTKGEKLDRLEVSTALTKVERSGRVLYFQNGAETHKVMISAGRRTKITLDGADAERDQLKVGMTCEIAYLGDGKEAQMVSCKR
jgi:iron(III) transport system substrate-binding protein